jgi:hypothetical protein
MHDCPTCGQPTPEGNFCVRCGAPLNQELAHSRHRAEYAAAPGERRDVPWLVSTLFPHLPRHSEGHFHIALGVGTALVIVLGALRLFPVALIVAAVLLPLLTVVYLYDVNVYGSDPPWAYGWTIVWGTAAGFGLGLLARATASTGSALIERDSTPHVLIGGVAIPALGVLAAVIGLLVLLRRRRFHEVLDGTTFGAATAAALAATEALVVGAGVLSGGLRPAGAAAPWIARLVAIAIATPVLTMSSVALVGAALWLRYRAPMKERGALGPLGRPVIATMVAMALVVAGAIGETFLPAGAWLAWLVAFDVVGLLLLRRTLHIGLLEEASERDIGEPIRCANCGAMTAAHTFCGHCGISLKALPKPAPEAPATRGSFSGRLAAELHGAASNRQRLLVSGAALGALLAAAFASGALAAPGAPAPPCKPGVPCAIPPTGPSTPPRYTAWRSSGLGFSLRYNDHEWSPSSTSPDQLVLEPTGDRIGRLTVKAVRSSRASPASLLAGEVASLRGQLLGLASDPAPGDQLLGTNVGFRPGPGAVYTGTTSTPQGPQDPVALAIVAAGNGRISIVVTAVGAVNDVIERTDLYQSADDIINSVQWPGVQ